MDNHNVTEQNLRYAIYATSTIFILEVAGGLFTNSLALLSDAAHMFMDVFALLLTYASIQIAKKPSTCKVTFGYHRLEIFSALINGVTLILVSGLIAREAYFRLLEPPSVKGFEMLLVATVGLLVNLWVTYMLHGHHDLNIRGAYLQCTGRCPEQHRSHHRGPDHTGHRHTGGRSHPEFHHCGGDPGEFRAAHQGICAHSYGIHTQTRGYR